MLFQSKRKAVFSHFGINTICPTNLTVNSFISAMFSKKSGETVDIGATTIGFEYVHLKGEEGQQLGEIKRVGKAVIGILNLENTVVLKERTPDYRVKPEDKIIVADIFD